MRLVLSALITLWFSSVLPAQAEMSPRDGWRVERTEKPFGQLLEDVRAAVTANGYGVVTQAGPTQAARSRGITIPGNQVIGVFNNDVAVRVLNLSTAAMIEAPIRMYVTENADGSATLSYKLPSTVLGPYVEEAGPELAAIADELDAAFAAIADTAIR